MLVSKTNPVGIDWHIQQLQTKLHNTLVGADYWSLTDTGKYRCYGRCYRNKTDNGYIAEHYESANEYREVYWDDALSVISFFGISDNIELSVGAKTDVHLVFFVKLTDLAPSITHRADEEVRNQVLKVIGKSSNGFTVNSVELWLENVLREYSGSRRDERLKYVDMHPVHCFRINMSISYKTEKIC